MIGPPNIVLVGATGYTGRLIARSLKERGFAFAAAVRSSEKLASLAQELELDIDGFLFDIRRPERFVESLAPRTVVVNCVGPFGVYSRELLEALARKEVIYLDVCGEQQFVKESLEQHHRAAEHSGATLIHACAFESFLTDTLARELVEPLEELHQLRTFYWFERMIASPGTRLTMRLVNHFDTFALLNGSLTPLKPGSAEDLSELPFVGRRNRAIFAPYPEVIFFAKRLRPTPLNAGSYLLVTPGEARLMSRTAGDAPKTVEEIVRQHEGRPRPPPSNEIRASQRCGVAVLASTTSGRREWLKLAVRDPYGLTAFIIAWAIAWLAEHPLDARGVRTPGEVFPAEAFLSSLREQPRFFEILERG